MGVMDSLEEEEEEKEEEEVREGRRKDMEKKDGLLKGGGDGGGGGKEKGAWREGNVLSELKIFYALSGHKNGVICGECQGAGERRDVTARRRKGRLVNTAGLPSLQRMADETRERKHQEEKEKEEDNRK
ncbi:hypothetical protein E2C01_072336 [Portunus trituberculatus]|uniref:Uncharacterized protein n=1 Tax=Portunus trituberculatus TaxID=210409 RepID=A0A5B7I8N7_PORTR|nr:hypothetical protein [Portunus trituberculatus]